MGGVHRTELRLRRMATLLLAGSTPFFVGPGVLGTNVSYEGETGLFLLLHVGTECSSRLVDARTPELTHAAVPYSNVFAPLKCRPVQSHRRNNRNESWSSYLLLQRQSKLLNCLLLVGVLVKRANVLQ